jgi:hypothetical protein
VFAYGDVGQWRRPDIQGFVGLLGCELDAASRLVVDWSTVGNVELTPESLDRFGFGECCRIDISGLRVEPREPAEAREYFKWEWDAEYEPPYRWALQPIPDDELFYAGWPPASDLGRLRRHDARGVRAPG